MLASSQEIRYQMVFFAKTKETSKICHFYNCSFLLRVKKMACKSAIRMIRLYGCNNMDYHDPCETVSLYDYMCM